MAGMNAGEQAAQVPEDTAPEEAARNTAPKEAAAERETMPEETAAVRENAPEATAAVQESAPAAPAAGTGGRPEATAKRGGRPNRATILREHINCRGCGGDGVKTVFCERMCAIRQCSLKRGVTTCGGCPELESCQTVGAIFQNNSAARKNLEEAARLTNSNSE